MGACTGRQLMVDDGVDGINYSGHITRLMHDLVARVPELAGIDLGQVLVFARQGRTGTEGPYASCHCLSLPDTEPGYFYWRDAATGQITRRSEWFVTRSPKVQLGERRIDFLVSFSLPRFCDQRLSRSRKRNLYPAGTPDWIAKLDTIVHELYHIDPSTRALREFLRDDGQPSGKLHGPGFFEHVARMVQDYLALPPNPELVEFLKYDFAGLIERYSGVVGVTFRSYPAFPRRYREVVSGVPLPPEMARARVEHIHDVAHTLFTEHDLQLRQFGIPDRAA